MGSDQQSETAERRRRRLTISSAGVAEGSEAGLGSGEEAFDEAGLVLHSAEPGLYRCGELGDVTLGAAGARCCRRLPSPPGSGRDGPRCGPSAVLNPGRTRPRRPATRPPPRPPFYDGPRLLTPRGDRRLVPLRGPPGRDLDAPPDPVQQHVHPRQRVLDLEPPGRQAGDPGQRPALVLIPPPHGRARVQRRHRFADIRDTRSRLATSPSPAPDSINSAAPSRTRSRRDRSRRDRSRRDRSAAVRPPPSGYLITPAYLEMAATARGRNLRH
jgi:hypothetical protein